MVLRMPSGWTPEPAGASVPSRMRSSLAHLPRGTQSVQGGALVTVVHDFEAAPAAFADAGDLIVRQGGMPAIDMADDIGVGGQDDVLVDQPRAGDRRAASMDGALDAVFARPGDHLAGRLTVLHRAQPDLAEQADTGFGEIAKILLDHAVFDDRRPGMHFDAGRAKGRKGPLRGDGECLDPDDVARSAGHVHFAGGDHRGDAAMQARVDPAELILARRPVAGNRMHMAVDKAGDERRPVGIDHGRGVVAVDVLLASDGGDATVDGNQRISVKDRLFESARQEQPDVADHQLGRTAFSGGNVG